MEAKDLFVQGLTDEAPQNGALPEEQEETPEQKSARLAAEADLRAGDGDFVGAHGEYKKAAELAPESSERLTKLADSYAALDLPHKAIDYYQRALRTAEAQNGADLSEAHLGLGDLCRTFAMSAAAVRSYTRVVRQRPKVPFYRWKLGVALAATGLYEQAEQQLQTALELAPRDTFYRFALAEIYLVMGRMTQAIDELREVVQLAPRDDYYQLRLGAALLRAGRAAEALPHFHEAVRLKPQNSSYRTLLRYAYVRNHQEPPIAVDVDMIELGPYDEDFVRRIQLLSQPTAHANA